jgi:hypothetical protein
VLVAAVAARQDAASRQRAQGGHQRERGEHDEDDGGEGRVAEGGVGLQRRQPEAEKGDQDGEAGDDDGSPCGARGAGGRLAGAEPGTQALDMAGHEQQRVVDADAKAEHFCHGGRGGADVGERAEQPDDGGARA